MTHTTPAQNYHPTLLLIDDETDLLIAWGLLLEFEGFNVVTTEHGLAGIELARALKPALVITDMMMPGTDGTEVCRRIKSDRALQDIPVILWTASSDIPASIQCDRVLRKPVARETMVRHIRSLLAAV